MRKASAGNFAITMWDGGYPIWCQLHYEGREIANGINALELADLEFTIKRARMEARDVARQMDVKRVEEY